MGKKMAELETELQSLKLSLAKQNETPKPTVAPIPVRNPRVLTHHYGITCDGCQKSPIVGRRFKCLQCFNFDLCEDCEAKGHDHPMVRIVAVQNHHLFEKL